MPVKLNKVLKDLNVGLQTVVDYLRGKRFEVESNPNVRIPMSSTPCSLRNSAKTCRSPNEVACSKKLHRQKRT